MERKVGEVFNDGENKMQVVISDNGNCTGCHYWGSPCDDRDECCKGLRSDGNSVIFKKIGESKMDNKEELKRSLAEEEQRAKDSLANVEKMKKQLEELNKKEVEVSATGVYLIEPKPYKDYNYIETSNRIDLYQFTTESDKKRLSINNCFATKEQAEQEALRREGQEFIRRCAMLWNKGNDWRKALVEQKFHIYYGCGLMIGTMPSGLSYGDICFDSINLAERCISELKAKYNEEQIKIIFGVI